MQRNRRDSTRKHLFRNIFISKVDYLRKEGLLEKIENNDTPPKDVTKEILT